MIMLSSPILYQNLTTQLIDKFFLLNE